MANQITNATQLREHRGPAYNYYAKRQAAGFAAYAKRLQAEIDAQARHSESLDRA